MHGSLRVRVSQKGVVARFWIEEEKSYSVSFRDLRDERLQFGDRNRA
jgi:hypothetical protein